MLLKSVLTSVLTACSMLSVDALVMSGKPNHFIKDKRALQSIVTYDEHSLFVHGERVMLYSGEYHPFRIPVQSMHLDIFQKIKALGYNCVSFYVDWALLEGTRGVFRADGIFDLQPFFDAASQAGIYLLARPGPYINAEVAGGGFPGWLQRVVGQPRTNDTSYLQATDLYAQRIGEIIAKAQITNGGPIILVQPENEYSAAEPGVHGGFPNYEYFQYVENQLRNAGIIVPFISNDAGPNGYDSPSRTTVGAVDIYGHDGYPLGFNCGNPYNWPNNALPTTWRALHLQQSPNTPYSIVEFQGGSFDPWAGPGFAKCLALLGPEFERVFYKNDYSFGVTFLNLYMTYGGTNWGNLGHPGGYTSYDYAAVISEDRQVNREKYSEQKLQVNFLMASPAYLTATPGNRTVGVYTDSTDLGTTPLFGNGSATNFYVVRHNTYNSLNVTMYKFKFSTSKGSISAPQLGGQLTLTGRDSKIHVSDYKVGSRTLLYSTAEIMTHTDNLLVVYGGPNERHELAFVSNPKATLVEGGNVKIDAVGGSTILNWSTTKNRRIVQVGNLFIHILDRQSAYNYWVLPLANGQSFVANAGYLLRNATISGTTLNVVGDLNATSTLEVLSGAPSGLTTLSFNGKSINFKQDAATGMTTARLVYTAPMVSLPAFGNYPWKYRDSLPEIKNNYDDSAWTVANLTKTLNPFVNNTTPVSLFSGDYGYSTGSLIYRGRFTSTGNESTIYLQTQGGSAYGMSAWLNNTYLGSWPGIGIAANHKDTFTLPKTKAGQSYVLTVVMDHMGNDEHYYPGDGYRQTDMRTPRGILNYTLSGRPATAISWKLTGNLGGENYVDLQRGPLNEGAMYAERQGWHQPSPPSSSWQTSSPMAGTTEAGIAFYTTTFNLDLPTGYDIPLSFVFGNTTTSSVNGTSSTSDFRAQLFVNGYQFGKYVNNIGPQTIYTVPQGILNYNGENTVALTLWAQQAQGAKLAGFSLQADALVQSGYGGIVASPQPKWVKRVGAY